MASPNVVEIQIKGTDQSSPAFQSAVGNTKKLGAEAKTLGSIVSATGNVMTSFGNDAVAKTAVHVTTLVFAAKEAQQALAVMQASMKRTVAGLAIVAVAFAGAKIMEYFENAAEAQKKLDEDTNTYIDTMNRLAVQMQTLQNIELGQRAEQKLANEERIKAIRELTIEDDKKNAAISMSTKVRDMEITRISKEFTEKRVKDAETERKKKIANQVQYADATATIFGNLATAAAAFGKKGFAAFKAFRIAEAIASTYSGAARALADYPWPYSIAVAASVVAAGLASVATIAASKPQGQAHSGMDYVPAEGSYKLDRGEMVLDPGTSENVRRLASSGGMGGDLYIDGQKFGRWLRRAKANGILEFA